MESPYMNFSVKIEISKYLNKSDFLRFLSLFQNKFSFEKNKGIY